MMGAPFLANQNSSIMNWCSRRTKSKHPESFKTSTSSRILTAMVFLLPVPFLDDKCGYGMKQLRKSVENWRR